MTIQFIFPHPGHLNCLKKEIICAKNYFLKCATHHTDSIIYYHLRGISHPLEIQKNMNCQNATPIATNRVLSHIAFLIFSDFVMYMTYLYVCMT